MGELQWALLIVCVVLVVLLYLFSRRGKAEGAGPAKGEASPDGQSDLFQEREASAGFDEFGVGKPRSRSGAPAGAPEPAPTPAPPPPQRPAGRVPATPSTASVLNPVVPPPKPAAPPPAAPAGAPARIFALIVAPTEETEIEGSALHDALEVQGLRFGEGEIYHRMIGTKIVYSVAGLLRPGKLIPAEAEEFSTRGLTVALQLPGPVQAEVAFDDMVTTARALARALKAEVFDAKKQRLTDEVAAAHRADLVDWARAARNA